MKNQEKDKRFHKAEKFHLEEPYYICAVCHHSLYQHSVRLFHNQKYNVLTSEMHHPATLFNGKVYVCETCHKHLAKYVISCQAVCNNKRVDPIFYELKYLKCFEKKLISKRTLYKKALIHEKGQFSTINGTMYNFPIESTDICNVLPRLPDSNGIYVVKIK